MAHHVFISYSGKDEKVADAVCQALEAAAIPCWYARRDNAGGMTYEEQIIDAISQSKLMVLILSSNSNASEHVKREVQNAFRDESKVPVLPFQIEPLSPNKSFKYYLSSVHWVVAETPVQQDHLEKLVKSVKKLLAPPTQDREVATQSFEPGERVIPSDSGAWSAGMAWRNMALTRRSKFLLVIAAIIVLGIIAYAWMGQLKTTSGNVAAQASAARGDYFFKQENFAEAEKYFQEAVRLEPNNADYNQGLGLALFNQGKDAEAEIYFRSTLRLRPDVQGSDGVRNDLGNALMRQQKYEEAESQFSQAVKLSPTNAVYHYNVGRACLDQQNYNGAVSAFKKAAGLVPDDANYLNQVGSVLEKTGNNKEALDWYRRATKFSGDPVFKENVKRLEALQTKTSP